MSVNRSPLLQENDDQLQGATSLPTVEPPSVVTTGPPPSNQLPLNNSSECPRTPIQRQPPLRPSIQPQPQIPFGNSSQVVFQTPPARRLLCSANDSGKQQHLDNFQEDSSKSSSKTSQSNFHSSVASKLDELKTVGNWNVDIKPLAFSTPQQAYSSRSGLVTPDSVRSGIVIVSRTPSITVLPYSSQSSGSSRPLIRSMDRRPPQTPPSNFTIVPPELSSDSGSESSDDDNIFPPGWGNVGGLRDITKSRWRQPDNHPQRDADGSRDSESVLGENGSVHSAAIRRRRQLLEGRADDGPKEVVLCVLWAATRFAASYYDLESGQLSILPDISDSAPDFTVLRSVYSQVNPTYVLINKSADERFLEVVYELTGNKMVARRGGDDDGNNDPTVQNTPAVAIRVYQIPSKEYSLDTCKSRVLALQLPFEPANLGAQEHTIFITSLIPFSNEVMVRTMGCLLKFLDKSAIELFQLELVRGHIPIADVVILKMDDIVIVDDSAWRSLQVFTTDFHPSSFKQGISSGSKEGLSVYSILNGCVTTQGAKALRLMLLRPTRNPAILNRRYDVLDYCININNMEFVASATNSLKSIKSIPKLLYRLSLLHATVAEWKQLYQAMYNCLLLAELCRSIEHAPELISNICSPEFIGVLRCLTQEMIRVIDFDQSNDFNRIVAKEGLDPELDRKKKQYACLPEIMSIVASEEMAELPEYITQCCAVYIPEVGYLLAVTLWRPDLTDAELNIDHLEYRFKTHELAYYKSARMRELDVVLGDCSVAILEKETIMMVRLTEMILQKSSALQRISDLVSELDSLIAISAVAKSNNFVRPVPVSTDQKLKIVDGRHSISSMLCEFVPNSTIFRGQEKVVVLTGPNASGKSVYLKQVGVIVIMALSGSFVPATFAQIPLYDKICTRVHAVESVSSGFSSFMVDINQMSLAIRSSSKDSLVIIDEFGKGTLEADGLSILTTSIQELIDRKVNCPTIFLCTHFSSMIKYLQGSALVKYQSMKYLDENGTITYLYELRDGSCETSFAARLAKDQGIPQDVVDRAIEMENITRRRTTNQIQPISSQTQVQKEADMITMASDFLQLDFTQLNPMAYLTILKRKFEILERNDNDENED